MRFVSPASVVTVALSLALVPGVVTTAAEGHERARTRTAQIRIATYNVHHEVAPSRTVADVVRLAQRADIITLQEMSNVEKRSRVRQALVSCRECRWSAYMPSSAVPGATPILFRKNQYRLERADTVQVTPATRVGGAGAGPSVLRAKFINFVKLTELKTRRTVWVLNNHTVPSVQGDGGMPNRRNPKRLALYRQHMAGLTALVTRFERRGGLVFATGDFNVNFRTDRRGQAAMFPYATMRAVGLKASYLPLGEPARGTHALGRGRRSTRLIDYVHFLPRRGLRPVGEAVLRRYASDHRPLLVHFTVTAR